jgi:hypothetical protein
MVTEITLEDRITAMLKENTGASFLDSGGAYGRNYERNQKRDFKSEPACTLDAENWHDEPTIDISFNIWHYLTAYLDYDDDCEFLNKEFQEFCNSPEHKEDGYFTCMEAWTEERQNEPATEEDKFSEVYSANNYNYDNLLSQTIQYTHFIYKEKDYILLQIHGGCDVRGGYTEPVIFKTGDNDYFELAQHDCYLSARYPIDERQKLLKGIEPPKELYSWYSDDSGAHWYSDDGEPELKLVLEVHDDKAYVNIGGKLLELTASVSESY